MRITQGIYRVLATAFALVVGSAALAADDGIWVVRRFSGEVWTTTGEVQQASLKTDDVLMPGSTIRTGRVLLVRGEESILIAPNSVIGTPSEKRRAWRPPSNSRRDRSCSRWKRRMSSISKLRLRTSPPWSKGRSSVTVNPMGAKVNVARGQVEVVDFKTGQIAQVLQGQHATTILNGKGLSLGGSGTFQPMQNGQPRASTLDRVTVPRNGLSAPSRLDSALSKQRPHASGGPKPGAIRITSSLGEARVNVHRVTHGLARNVGSMPVARQANREKSTVWASNDSDPGSAASDGSNTGNGNRNGGNGNSHGGNASQSAFGGDVRGVGMALGASLEQWAVQSAASELR